MERCAMKALFGLGRLPVPGTKARDIIEYRVTNGVGFNSVSDSLDGSIDMRSYYALLNVRVLEAKKRLYTRKRV